MSIIDPKVLTWVIFQVATTYQVARVVMLPLIDCSPVHDLVDSSSLAVDEGWKIV